MHESMGRKLPPLLRERRPSQHLDIPIPFNDGLTKLARIAQKQLLSPAAGLTIISFVTIPSRGWGTVSEAFE